MKDRLGTLPALLLSVLCPGMATAQTAVPVWQQTFRPAPTSTTAGNPFAARQLADGTYLVVTDDFQAIHYSPEGSILGARPLAIGSTRHASKATPPRARRSPEGPQGAPLPPGYGRTFATIDAFGRVAIALLSDPDYQFAYSGDVELARFDGLTGLALWRAPVFYGLPGTHYPTGLFEDRNGDLILTALKWSGQKQAETLKYDGQTGALLWGPMLFGGVVGPGVSTLLFGGDVVISVPVIGQHFDTDVATVRYASSNGSLVWGPVVFDGGNGAQDVPTALLAGSDGGLYVGARSDENFAILKYDDAGRLAWGPVGYPGPAGVSGSQPTDLILDARGGLFVTGLQAISSTDVEIATFKLSAATGETLWSPDLIPVGVDSPSPALVSFGNGDVAVRAVIGTPFDKDVVFARYRGSDGVHRWGPADLGQIAEAYPLDYAPLIVSSNGDVFGAAVLVGTGSSAFELDGDTGSIVWGPTPFAIPASVHIYFEDLTVGNDGNVVAAGDNYPVFADATVKFDGTSGRLLWGPVSLSSGQNVYSTYQVLTDSASNVIQIGFGPQAPYIVKYSGSDGSVMWGPTPLPGVGFSLTQMKLDAAGNAYVIGYVCGDDQCFYYHAGVTKVSGATGAVLWGPSIFISDPSQSDFPRGLGIATSGDVVVVGDSYPPTGPSWFAVAYAGDTGALRWGPVGEPGTSDAWSAEGLGNDYVVTGSTDGGMTTVKYSGVDGSKIWGPMYVTALYGGSGTDLAVDAAGDVFAAGGVETSGTGSDWVTIKYRGSDGATLWGPNFFDGEAHGYDFVYALGLGVDAAGNVVVGGTSQTIARGEDIAVIEYAGVDGATLWGPVYAGGGGNESLYGFGVHGNFVAAGAPVDGAFFIQAWDESLGIQNLPADLEPASCGQPYQAEFIGRNGASPYSWSVVAGALPPGLALSPTGILAGTPVEQGTFAFTIRVTDSGSATYDRAYVLLVVEAPPPVPLDAAVDFCSATLSVPGTWTSYLWFPNGETTPTIVVSPTQTTTYGVAVTGADGCPHHLSVTVPGIVLQSSYCSGPRVDGVSPSSGPPSGGTAITITGANFENGATVQVGGIAATGVSIVDSTQALATTPAVDAGHWYPVTIINPDTGTAAQPNAWFADFLDVPPSNIFHDDIAILAGSGVTAGCGGGSYCPDAPATRAQMAVFLLRSEHGAFYTPPPCFNSAFYDVPCADPFAPWINQLYTEGVTTGCGSGNYCPGSPVTRAQMAVFLLKTRNGSAYNPPPATGIFADVPASDPFAAWIEKIYADGITGGCSASPLLYCPGSPTTRGQMAVFLVKTFSLP